MTQSPPAEPVDGVEFHPDVESGLAAAKAAAGDDYVNVLGAAIARQCLELGELDEVLAIIAPLLLGDGTPLFHHAGGRSVRLERICADTASLATNVWMRVVG